MAGIRCGRLVLLIVWIGLAFYHPWSGVNEFVGAHAELWGLRPVNVKEVVSVQLETQNVWTRRYIQLARLRYHLASGLWILTDAFNRHNIQANSGIAVLDYGFGHGWVLFWFTRTARIYGVELSPQAIENATKRALAKGYASFEFKQPPADDPVRIEFPSESFDLVVCSHTLEHVHDDEKLLHEFWRVLKRSGRLIVLVPLDAQDRSCALSREDRLNPGFPARSFHVWRYNLPTLRTLAEGAGFHIIEARAVDAIGTKRRKSSRLRQIGGALFWALAPRPVWNWFDERLQRQGVPCAQGLLVCVKPLT